jgi:putative membrane protein
MMYGYAYGPWGWTSGLLGGLVNIILIVILIAVVIRIIRRNKDKNWKLWNDNAAENLLKERFVKGEISKEEYEEKLKTIRS